MAVKPPAEVDLTPGLVRALLAEQHPDLAGLPLRLVAHGWDNATFRLGPDLAVRLPRRSAAADLVLHEQRWLPELARHCPLPVPAPVRTGRPSAAFPWAWSVVPWLDGRHAADQPVPDRARWAERLADAIAGLHVPAPPDAPRNPVRGGPLTGRAAALADRIAAGHLDRFTPDARARADALWRTALDAPQWSGPPVWLHGDPHPANLVVTVQRPRPDATAARAMPAAPHGTTEDAPHGTTEDAPRGTTEDAPRGTTRCPPHGTAEDPPHVTTGCPRDGATDHAPNHTTECPPHPSEGADRGDLVGLLDFGDLGAGDPACDLATAWLTFDAAGRASFRARIDRLASSHGPADAGRWQRAAGWALVMASAMVAHGDDDPTIAGIGAHTIVELLGHPEDAPHPH